MTEGNLLEGVAACAAFRVLQNEVPREFHSHDAGTEGAGGVLVGMELLPTVEVLHEVLMEVV